MPRTKLPKVGTTIFTVMSQLAAEHQAVNLGQGFPDFPAPARLLDALDKAIRAGHNQYSPMSRIPVLLQPSASRTERRYGRRPDAAADVHVDPGASDALFDAATALVQGRQSDVKGK